MEAIFLFPHQLDAAHPLLKEHKRIFLIETKRHFTDFSFHKQKLVYHHATMHAFKDILKKKGKTVSIIPFHSYKNFQQLLTEKKIDLLHYIDPVDHALDKELKQAAKTTKTSLKRYQSRNFFLSEDEVIADLEAQEIFFLFRFYKQQRKRFGILVENDQPIGGKWSYDADNRKKLPKDFTPPSLWKAKEGSYQKEAKAYVEKHFPKNPGSLDACIYPITRKEALASMQHFFAHRFSLFGDYQDAMDMQHPFLFHSLLSAPLNISLIQPQEVIQKALAYAKEHTIPLHTLEGFIRQILGWREFIRGVYLVQGEEQRKGNYWKHERALPASYWKATTGIPPIDTVITKTLQTSYAHHIERLMILSNFMQLNEFKPDDVYTWFMEMYIDAYDWVMVPNVYGMALFADGGTMVTKPYISSSNYLRKMGRFPRGEWEAIWDGLYWRFIKKHKAFFAKNVRLSMMVRQLEKMGPEKLQNHLSVANAFLRKQK